MRTPNCAALTLFCIVAMSGCTTTPPAPPPGPPTWQQRNDGYALLYKLMDQESNVSKLLIIKHADKPLHDLIEKISTEAGKAKKQMDDFKKSDDRLEYNANGLPDVEQESRNLESHQDAKSLLTSGGKAFELELTFTQAQAMGYGANLAKALDKYEENPQRKSFLEGLSANLEQFRVQLMAMLTPK